MPRRSRTSGRVGGRSTPSRMPSRVRAGAPRSSSSSARTAAPPARQSVVPKSNAMQKSSSAPPPAPQASSQGSGSAMGGFMANVASTGLGVMAGRAMDRAFFGGGTAAGAPEVVPESAGDTYSNSAWEEQIPETVCAREALEFKKCMERNESDVASCQWNLDILAACQRQQQETGFADASRL